ncbi:MAG: PDZ domain-containing protein [Pseudomonadota bacterium]|nr:PDZ domain-containing protein [Pseudomonadota bacterium]
MKSFLLLIFLASLAACVNYDSAILTPTVSLSSEEVNLSPDRDENLRVDFGLELGLNESDSLLSVEVLPGVRVRNVIDNGAADLAGLQVGDIILTIDRMETNHPDTIKALQQTSTNSTFEFRGQRNTTVFETTVHGRAISNSTTPEELYRIDPIATRAGYRSEMVSIGNETVAAARIVELFPESPLPKADIAIDDLVLRLNGVNLNSAQDLITRIIRDHELGEEVALTVYNGDQVAETTVQLWDPGRRISRINIGPLLQYESSLSPSSETFSLLDFWLFAVYSYSRIEGERSHNIFGLFNITSDYGELTEIED